MIKIIKNNYRKHVYVVTCPYCTSILETEDEDFGGRVWANKDYKLVCPACAIDFNIGGEDVLKYELTSLLNR